ncbi:MAG TPA: glycosyltransferase [Candidatus Acidoferrum sp.]|nr:glycosyltransferase [Candidatus Acidoferrum sp.]
MSTASTSTVEFAVVIPAYQAAAELPGSLETVRAQRHPVRETIVVDDGSNDATTHVALQLGARVILTPHAGVGAARNTGITRASAEWIAFLDADDRWSPRYLARIASAICRFPHANAVFTDYRILGNGDDYPSAHAIDRHLRAAVSQPVAPAIVRYDPGSLVPAYLRSRTFVQTSALVVRRTTLLRLGGYDEDLRVAEDFELLLRLFADSPVLLIQEPLTTYRKHPGTLVDGLAVEGFAWERRVWEGATTTLKRYPASLVTQLATCWPARLCEAGSCALRLGRFDHARARFTEAHRAGARAAFLGLAVATLLDNQAGRSCYGLAHACWRRRPRRWSRPARLISNSLVSSA